MCPSLAFSYLFGAQVQHASVISRTDRASYREAGGIGPLRQLTPIDTRVGGGLQRLVTSAPPPYSRPIVVPSQFLSMQRTGGRYNLNVEENLHVLRIFQTGRAVCSAHCAQIFASESGAAASQCDTVTLSHCHSGTNAIRHNVKHRVLH